MKNKAVFAENPQWWNFMLDVHAFATYVKLSIDHLQGFAPIPMFASPGPDLKASIAKTPHFLHIPVVMVYAVICILCLYYPACKIPGRAAVNHFPLKWPPMAEAARGMLSLHLEVPDAYCQI